ncbi:MAG: hypothetical protein WCL71_16785, partial [Deltaproteobacteria bacterium]
MAQVKDTKIEPFMYVLGVVYGCCQLLCCLPQPLVRSILQQNPSCGVQIMAAISQDQFETITVLARSYGATRLFLFGSALDNPVEARDIDLACDG